MNWRRLAFWFGVLALADAALLVAPVGLPEGLFAGTVPTAIVPLLALVAAGYGVAVLATAGGGPRVRISPPSGPTAAEGVDRVGADLDAAFDALSSEGGPDWSREGAARMLRSELRRGVEGALEARGHSPPAAERLVAEGAWTDDPRAAAFIGDETLPLATRIRDWATGEATRRQAEAATEALAELTAPGRGGDGRVPERSARRPATEVLGGAAGDSARTEREGAGEREVDG